MRSLWIHPKIIALVLKKIESQKLNTADKILIKASYVPRESIQWYANVFINGSTKQNYRRINDKLLEKTG